MYIYLSGDVKSLPAVPPGGKPPLKDKEYTSGWILSDTDILRRLDGAAGEEDSFLPVKLSGKGALTQTASTLSAEDFQNLLTIVKRKLLEIYHHMEKAISPSIRYDTKTRCPAPTAPSMPSAASIQKEKGKATTMSIFPPTGN